MINTRPENCKHLADYDYLMDSMAEGLPRENRKRFAENSKIRTLIHNDKKKTPNQRINHIMSIFLLGMIEEAV
jgi:hypothetical protein